MKKILAATAIFLLYSGAHAQTMASIKAYGRPGIFSSYFGIDVILTNTINCVGTTTNKLRFLSNAYSGSPTYPDPANSNASFIQISEIISAAKSGFSIELVNLYYDSGNQVCVANNYFIHVQ